MLYSQDLVMTNVAYALYLFISIAMTIWVARVLSRLLLSDAYPDLEPYNFITCNSKFTYDYVIHT